METLLQELLLQQVQQQEHQVKSLSVPDISMYVLQVGSGNEQH
jgi:hypothetical protein